MIRFLIRGKPYNFFLTFSVLFAVLLCAVFVSVPLHGETELRAWEDERPYAGWRYHDFQNFRIIFEDHDLAVQEELQRIIQKHYAALTALLENDPKADRIHVIIDSRAQYSNAYFLPAPPTIILHTAAARYIGKDSSWLEYIFLHEFAHYLHLFVPEGVGEVLSRVFGDAVNPIVSRILTPGWAIEGLAVTVESEFISNGRLQDPFFIIPTRADILLGHFATYKEKSLFQFEFQFGESYQYGSFLFQHLKEKYGYEKLAEYWREALKAGELVKDTFGNFFDTRLDEEHEALYQKLYERFYQESGELPRGEQVSIKKSERTALSIVSDTEKGVLLYKRGSDTKNEFVYLSDDLETEETVLQMQIDFPYYGTGLADVNKDGTKVVFVGSTINPNATTTQNTLGFTWYRSFFNDLYLYDTEKKTTKRISEKQSLVMPSINDDATFSVVSQRQGTSSRLIKIDLERHREGFEILYEPTDAVVLEKDISPRSQSVVFVEKNTSEGNSLRLLDLETQDMRVLFASEIVHFYDPRFVSEYRIQFSSDIELPQKLLRLYEYDLQTGLLQRVAEDTVGVASAVQKRDGSILYLSNSGDGFELYQYDANEQDRVTVDTTQLSYLEKERKQGKTLKESLESSEVGAYPKLLSFLPSRFVYWFPSARVSFAGDNFEFSPGAEFLFQSSNGLSNLRLSFFHYFSTEQSTISFQPMYNINYAYSWRPIGDFLLSTSRGIAYNFPLRQYNVNYAHQFGFSRVLWNDLHNNQLSVFLATRIYHVLELEKDFSFEDSFDLFYASTYNEYDIRFTYTGSKPWLSRLNPLAWRLDASFNYRPPIWSTSKHEFISSLSSRIRIPVTPYFAFQIGNKSSHANISSPRSVFGLSRISRTQNPLSLFGSGPSFLSYDDEKFSLAPYKSVWSLDLIFPFGDTDDFGSEFIQPYSFSANVFTDHSFAVQEDGVFLLNSSFEAGVEVTSNLFLFRAPIKVTVGSIFRVPYAFDGFDYKVYVLFGTDLERLTSWLSW